MYSTMSLFESNITFAHLLFDCPEKALKLLDQAFLKAAYSMCNNQSIKTNRTKKVNLHVRLTALPNLPEIYRANLPNCSDVGQFMCISGTVIRATTSKVLEYRKAWRCTKCKFNFTVDAEVERGYIYEKPTACPNPDWCNGKNFTLLSTDVNPEFCKDYREVKIQQQFNTLSVGSVPKSMWVILEDDLVETCQPGNDVNISGVLIQRWKPLIKGSFIEIDLVLYAHNVEVKNKLSPGILSETCVNEFGKFWIESQKDPLKGRDFILSSICPQVFGLYVVKLAVALALAGGVEKKDGNSRTRGDSHLLLVGDPGTGKSQFLKFASKVCMRSVLTSGIGTTNAGLTVSAVKEGGKWQLEAGALVLADGGVCCIDEFSCIKEQDKTCIHEAMEQQTISVAKAGLVCSLSSKCSILAATNPKGKYDEKLSLSENTALASPLLSRFDIILVLLDSYDENWDKLVSSYILGGRELSSQFSKESLWSLEKMRNYFNFIRNLNPKVSSSCDRVLQAYYKRQRSLEGRNYARTTPRLLQSLIRLAEGHARLMFRSEALVIDAVMAIVLMESSMSGSAILDELTTLHSSFSEDPKTEYRDKAQAVLKLLNLEELLEESGDYKLAYQDLSVKSLLSKVSVLCDTSKNSYLGDSFGLNENTSAADYSKSTSILPKDDVADIFKKPLPLKHSLHSRNSPINNATKSVHLLEEIDIIDPEKNSFSEDHNKVNSLNNVASMDEVSTMSHLVNTFCDEGFQPEDITLDFPQKPKAADVVATNNNTVDQELESLAMEFENADTPGLNLPLEAKMPCVENQISKLNFSPGKLGEKRKTTEVIATNNNIMDQELESLAMEIENIDSTPELNLHPQAKMPCVEKPISKLQSFKQFSFQKHNQKKAFSKVSIANETLAAANDMDKVANTLPGKSNGTDKVANILPGKSNDRDKVANILPGKSNGRDKVANTLPGKSNGSDKVANILPGKNNDRDKVTNTLPGTSNFISKNPSNEIVKTNTTIGDGLLDQSTVQITKSRSLSDVKESGQQIQSSTPKRVSQGSDPNKSANKFTMFAFKSRPSKKDSETTPPKAAVIITQPVSEPANNMPSQSIEHVRSTQSSQSAFKRILSNSTFKAELDAEDLDDLMFEI
ncbi:hypothetical protein JTE90_008958 [Oedothorax gibbosus]|uniref:DNA helicase MCM9 n=1 Tax=Oedothorax gibbosus TaxID=931172 RepID=A0AAV6UX85_9ARAC|nr:hypothetical protein JTE90_008958 [Oedothorax gibbosus]